MMPSGVGDMVKQLTVNILNGVDLSIVFADVPCQFFQTSMAEIVSGIGLAAESDGSFYFRPQGTTPIPAIDETMVIDDGTTKYQIFNAHPAGGQGDHVRCFVRYFK